jgi:hypothetical protein
MVVFAAGSKTSGHAQATPGWDSPAHRRIHPPHARAAIVFLAKSEEALKSNLLVPAHVRFVLGLYPVVLRPLSPVAKSDFGSAIRGSAPRVADGLATEWI